LKQQESKGKATRDALGNVVESDEVFTARQPDTKTAIPAEVEKIYVRVGEKFYFPKNPRLVAFEDRGNKLETKSDNEQIADSMVRIAYARGWSEIKISGTETFRREVWLKATILGMSVKGYIPTEQDKVALAIHSRGEATNKIEKDEFRGRENSGRGEKVVEPEAALLISHGAAKFRHDESNNDSYYVTTRGADGSEQTVWGVDLQRAKDESGVKIGDAVFVNNVGRKNVTVTVPQYDEDGKISGSKEIQTHRNEWNIKMAEAFATQAPAEAVKNYPELAGAVAAVTAIDKKAVADGLSAPQRAIVSARARENAVNSIAKGEIPNVKIQNQEVERQTEEEYSR
jgi:hypothetical protein